LTLLVGRQEGHPARKKYGGWWRWALVKRKGKKSIYIAPFTVIHSSAQAWITQFYLQITPHLPFLRQRSPDVTTIATAAADLQLTTHLSTPKG